jgi:hypothetical protein
MMDSSVYVNSLTMLMRRAASRFRARNPLVVSGTLVPATFDTIHEPKVCRRRLVHEKWATALTPRSPTTMSASPARIGATSRGMSPAGYWLSASVLTMTSAPRRSDASRPAMKAAARPLRRGKRTT